MKYIQCKHCGAQISDRYEACPVCGTLVSDIENNKKKPIGKWVIIGILGLIVSIGAILCIVFFKSYEITTNVPSLTEPKLLSTCNKQHEFVCYSLSTILATPIEIEKDVDNDDKKEMIKLCFDQVGFAVTLSKKIGETWYGMEDILFDVENDDNYDEYFMQVSYVDLDADNVQEIIVTIGNCPDIYAFIYKVRNADEDSFKKIGEFSSQQTIILDDKHFICPYGGQGLYVEYIYDRGRIIKIGNL